jgi:hypothetical protein
MGVSSRIWNEYVKALRSQSHKSFQAREGTKEWGAVDV